MDHAFLLAGKSRILFVPLLNESFARSQFKGKVIAYRNPFAELEKHIKGKTVYADFSSLSAKMVMRLRRICKLKDHSAELMEKRMRKRKDEVSDIRKAVSLTKELISSLDLKSAKTELDLEKQIRVMAAEQGSELSFDPIVSSGSSTAFPHYKATKKKLGPLVLVDCGLKYNHYCADLTRCFVTGRMKKEYEKIQQICYSIADELPDLGTGEDVTLFSAKLMEKAGFPKMIHSIGHGIGLEVHELPRLSIKSSNKIAGTTLAIEPAFYLKKYGMRFEEDIFFDGKKARIL